MSEAKSLLEKRANIWSQMQGILAAAEGEKRDLTSEEDANWAKANDDLRALDDRIDQIVEAEARAASMAEAFRAISGKAGDQRSAGDFADELRSMLRGERSAMDVRPESRDLVKGTATAGGNTVPTSFYGQLQVHLTEMATILAAGATILNTDAGEQLEIPVTTSHSSAAIVSEGGAIPESDPAFGKRTLGAYKYGVAVQVARELIEDTGVDLEGYLSQEIGWALGNAFGAHLLTGTGTNQPAGLLPSATVGVTGDTDVDGVPTFDNLIDLMHSVIGPYRNGPAAKWIVRDATLAAIRKIKGSDGQYIWQPSVQVGVPDMILGKPVLTDPNMPAAAVGAKSVLFGDISRYFVRQVNGVRLERSTEVGFMNDLVTFKAILRGDGLLADQTGAVKVFQGGAS